ncbi:hypothetical protein WN943_011069 [Citrus x changshan-huyou]
MKVRRIGNYKKPKELPYAIISSGCHGRRGHERGGCDGVWEGKTELPEVDFVTQAVDQWLRVTLNRPLILNINSQSILLQSRNIGYIP